MPRKTCKLEGEGSPDDFRSPEVFHSDDRDERVFEQKNKKKCD